MNLLSLLSFFSYNEIVSKVSDLLILTDPSGRILKYNQAFSDLLGYGAEELKAVFVNDMISEKERLNFTELSRLAETEKNFSINFISRDASETAVKASIVKIKNDSNNEQVYGFMFVCQNIAALPDERKDRIRELELELKAANHRADKATSLKNEFISNISHEIRTPMNGIIGYSDLMFKTEMSERQRDFLQNIRTSGNCLLSIINDMLDFSKIETGKFSLETTSFSIEQLVCEVISVANVDAANKNLNILYSIDPAVKTNVVVDAGRLRQVLLNIVGNAVKFTERGTVRINIYSELETKTNYELNFEVSDDGIGIEKAMIEKIFQPFFQVDGSDTRSHGGTGLGLVISNNIVRLMGGERIFVESSPGKGSRFYFKLTLAKAADPKGAFCDKGLNAVESDDPFAPGTDEKAYKILLVEDNISNAELVMELLNNFCGHKVVWVQNGKLAVEKVEQDVFDIILMDIQMPVMDGKAATRMIRKNGYQTPIVALTASVMPWDYEECINVGMDAYASKPVNISKLNNLITSVINKKSKCDPEKALKDKKNEKAF